MLTTRILRHLDGLFLMPEALNQDPSCPPLIGITDRPDNFTDEKKGVFFPEALNILSSPFLFLPLRRLEGRTGLRRILGRDFY